MKIRQGFVSNSSSASYIVTINKPIEIIVEKFMSESDSDLFYKDNFVKIITDRKAKDKKSLKEHKSDKKDKMYKFFVDMTERDIEQMDEFLSRDLDNQSILFDSIMEKNGLKISDRGLNSTQIIGDTVMHNDYYTGVPKLLREIILYLSFETDFEIQYTVYHR